MKNISKLIGRRLAKERNKQGLSQEQLAELAETNRNYIGVVERGEGNTGINNIHKIASALNLKLEILFKKL